MERPVALSLLEIQALGKDEHITMHHCIQGWSGIAQWKGVPMKTLIDLVKPKPSAKTVVFFSFGEGLYGGVYYDTQSLENVLKPECLLAYEMNGEPLPDEYGAPLRLRVENQLGYKMVKWIERIEFVESEKQVGEGEGGRTKTMSTSMSCRTSDCTRRALPGLRSHPEHHAAGYLIRVAVCRLHKTPGSYDGKPEIAANGLHV